VLETARPDGRVVLASFRVNDRPAGTAVLPPEEARTLVVESLPPSGGILEISFSPTFVPADGSRSSDRRSLGVLLRGGPGGKP
jgi:hypothetical protein